MDDLLRGLMGRLEESAYEYGEGQFSEIEYCRWCHYARSHPHGDDCPIARIQQRLDTGGWIPPCDLPEERIRVIAYDDPAPVGIAFEAFYGTGSHAGIERWDEKLWRYAESEKPTRNKVNGWQPLPALPKEK